MTTIARSRPAGTTAIIITVFLSHAAVEGIREEYEPSWTVQDIADAIADDIRQSTLGQAAGRGMGVSATVDGGRRRG
jgi:hypothetical protein